MKIKTDRSVFSNLWPFGLILILLLVLGLACSLPSREKPDEPAQSAADAALPTPSPTLPPPPTPTAQPLPPALVEADPIPGVALSLQGALTFYFNQPMDRGSVEGTLVGEPQLSGRLTWLDDATLLFEPDVPFPPDTPVTIEMGTSVRAANGLALPEPIRLEYRTAAPLHAVQVLPEPGALEADPGSAIVATFDQPVVPLGADPASLPAAFTVEPALNGRGEWVNTSTYIFYPQPALAGGTSYTINFDPDLLSTTGSPLDGLSDAPGTLSWSFSTALPQWLSISPQADESFIYLDAPIQLIFNQAMEPASVEKNFALLDASGISVPGDFTWADDFSDVTFTPTEWLARSSAYTIMLLGTAQSQGGTSLGSDLNQRFYTVPRFYIEDSDPQSGGYLSNYQSISLYFSTPLDMEAIDPLDYITIAPAVPNLSVWGDEIIYLNGSFTPNTEYLLTVSSALSDRWGETLGLDYTLRFTTAPLEPTLFIAHGEAELFVTPKDTALTAQAASLNNIDFSIGSIPSEDIWLFLGPNSYENIRNYYPRDAQFWTQALDTSNSRILPVQLQLTPSGATLPPGMYHLSMYANALDYPPGPLLIISSYVNLTFKISATQAFVWALDLRNNSPVANAPLTIYDFEGNALASGSTDEQGIFQSPIPVRPDVYGTYYAILGAPSDETFSIGYSTWDAGLEGYEFNLATNYTGPHTTAYLYTDRPIYRPGQTVNFRAIVRQARNGRYALPDMGLLPVNILDGNYQTLLDLELPLSEYGSTHGQFTLSEGAVPGYYTLSTPYGLTTFQVAEYRKPEIDLQISAAPNPALAGQTLIAQVSARYFFDAPAGDVPLTWRMSAAPGYFDLPGYVVGVDDFASMLPFWLTGFNPYGDLVASGEGRTGPEGLLTLEIPIALAESTQRYTLEVTLDDESGSPVSARADVAVHPAEFYAGVRPGSWVGRAGEEIGFEIKTVDWDQQPSPNRDLIAVFQKVTWVRGQKLNVYGYPDYYREYSPVSSANFRTGADGLARLVFTPPEPGSYQLEISGGGALTQLTIWVSGSGEIVWPSLPNQHITLTPDQKSYRPGQNARVLIPNPLGENVQALVTLERGEVLSHQVLTISGSGYTLELPLGAEDAPNVYLAVTLIGRNEQQQFDFRQGYANLQVEPSALTLDVTLTPNPERASPGETVVYTVRVRDSNNRPVQGEFSLAIVDQSIFALADPYEVSIVEAFYGVQPLGVRTGLSLAAYANRLTDTSGGLGGGGGDEAIPPALREEFPDTAYWNAEIITDANGEAQITLQLPDNLTTWKALARGLTVDTRVGETQTELVSTKELLVRPVTPRFLVAGDHLRLVGIVHNNTASDLTAAVRLQATGLTLDDPAAATHLVSIPAGGRVTVAWWGTVEAVESVDLIFSAEGGDLSDATRPVWGQLPVLRYSAPQTFGTAGTLSEGGERFEIVSLPRTFDPDGGELRVELAPSLAAAMIPGLDVLEHYPYECTEQTLSRFLPNLETYRAIQGLGLTAPDLEARLERTLNEGLQRLVARQNGDGGWGWWATPSFAGQVSDPYITSYVLFGLSRARAAGAFVDETVIQRAIDYLYVDLPVADLLSETWQYDRLAFEHFALAQAGAGNPSGVALLYEYRSQLSPWAQAFLALALESLSPGDPRLRELYSDLESSAIRTGTGTHWEDSGARVNMETPAFSTAVVLYALAQHDPASATLPEAVRYLMAARTPDGAWASTYETAWAILALNQVMVGTGELAGDFGFTATLNGIGLISGSAGGDTKLNPVSASAPVNSLYPTDPNALRIQREAGAGRLYYTAHLNVLRPVEDVAPLASGIHIERSYENLGATDQMATSDLPSTVGDMVRVKVALTLEQAAYYLVIEDYIPAGAEILNTSLKTSQQIVDYDPRDPFGEQGWGWWYFNDPQIYDEHIAWSVDYLPAGTYELTYTLVLNQPGAYRVLPARAWQFYFPTVQGNSAGAVFVIGE